jgi:hypothetical protein
MQSGLHPQRPMHIVGQIPNGQHGHRVTSQKKNAVIAFILLK